MAVHKKNQEIDIRQENNGAERRISRDFWARVFIVINYLAWGTLFVSMLVFHRAQPEFETFFDRFYLLDIRTDWDRQFLTYLGYVMGVGFAISLFGLCLSLYRARRKTDHKKNLIILGCLYLFLLLLAWFLW